jgi:hypothetical protein
MHCANCNGKQFFFNDAEELYPGSELVFCYACRKKVTPFLEERNTYPTHAMHLDARRRELEAVGVTPSGMSALAAYCNYLDRISPRRDEVAAAPVAPSKSAVPTLAQVVPAKDIVGKIEDNHVQIVQLNRQMDNLQHRMRLVIWAACTGGAASIGSFIALLMILLGLS